MTRVQGRPPLRGADDRLLRGYGPLLGLVLLLLLVAFLVPTVQPEKETITTGAGGSFGADATVEEGALAPGAVGQDGAALPASGAGTSARGAVSRTELCPGRQVPTDPYSPPCIRWSGDNGGATSPGVTAATIDIGVRRLKIPNIAKLARELTGGKVNINETQEDVERTYRVLAEYFNRRFQFYGRKLNVKIFDGDGDLLKEALGGGKDLATADATKASREVKVFADAFALTEPYSDALTKQKPPVIAMNSLYFSREWFASHSPYAFSIVPDCTKVTLASTDFVLKQLRGRPAEFAGGEQKGKPRKFALLAPDNPIYQQCSKVGVNQMRAAGLNVVEKPYPLDLNFITGTGPGQMVSFLKSEGVTSVILATDPVLPLLMGDKAKSQKYFPEWILTGAGLTDTDYVGQLMTPEQWTHSFGVSYLAKQQPNRASDGYRAYKEVDPGNTIAELTGQILYYALEHLAIGIQMAGPTLTPQTFLEGYKRYQGGTGQAGTWKFTEQNPWTPNVDGRVVWWDPTGISSYNDQPGTYADNGQRYPLGQLPQGGPPLVYIKGPPD